VRQRVTVNFAQWSTVRLRAQSKVLEVRRQSATTGHTGLSGVQPDCPVQQKNKRLQWSSAPNPNGRLTWHSPDNEQWRVRCAHRQNSRPTARIVVGAINTPNHHHSSHPSIPHSSFDTRAKNILQIHNQSLESSPSSKITSSNQKYLVTWERVTYVPFVAWFFLHLSLDLLSVL
jgi:hypothetical protein